MGHIGRTDLATVRLRLTVFQRKSLEQIYVFTLSNIPFIATSHQTMSKVN